MQSTVYTEISVPSLDIHQSFLSFLKGLKIYQKFSNLLSRIAMM